MTHHGLILMQLLTFNQTLALSQCIFQIFVGDILF